MNKKYVYLHHEGMEIFITEQELSKEECYCSYCDDYDTLIEVCDNEESFGELLTRLFAEGHDLVPCDDFNELIEKYGTNKQKKWYFEEQYYSVSKGPFWIVCSVKDYNIDFSNAELIAYPVPIETEPVPSHKNVWKEMKRSKPWNYYPRGRVEIRRNKAVVFANPVCFEYPELQKQLDEKFNLNGMEFCFKADNSFHYAFGMVER